MPSEPFISIFNDVIGPIMRGPSSSHTAGAYRIAQLALSLFGHRPSKVRCSFDPEGSYAPTYRPLGVDKAFCAGLIGMDMVDPSYESAVVKAESMMNVQFSVEPLAHPDHPNTARIQLYGDKSTGDKNTGDKSLTVWAQSIGGGVVEIVRVNDHTCSITGKHREALILFQDERSRAQVLRFIASADELRLVGDSEATSTSIQIRLLTQGGHEIDQLRAEFGVEVLVAEPVFYPMMGRVIATSAADILSYAQQKSVSLGKAGLAYECEVLGFSEEQALREMETRFNVMRQSIDKGQGSAVNLQWLQPHAGGMNDALKGGSLPYGGYHAAAATRAHAVMHTCNSRGVVCAAPTGGSAGVIPGVLETLEQEFGHPRPVILEALFAAGAIGLVMAHRATFAAESAGCQVEIGIAGAMAAASAVDAAGGDPAMAMNAAAISLQNTMGSVCDPVGGGCEIPCHTRNGVAASSAFTCADLVWGGYQNPIPLDETVDASYDVGTRLHSDLRCTARGGIAIAPSALQIVRHAEETSQSASE